MNETQALMRYIISEALKVIDELSATGGANTGGGSTFAVTPGEGYVTPNAFRRKKTKKEAIKEDDEHDIGSLGTKSPSPGQVPTGYSGDIERIKTNLGIKPQDKVISTKRGGRNNPYALAHWMAKKGIKPTAAPIPSHEPAEKLPGELDRQATIDREARLRAQAAARGQIDPATGRPRRGRPKKVVPKMPTGTPTENTMMEKAPPGMEDTVMALKKKYPGDHSKAFKIAWSMYNKKNEAGGYTSGGMKAALDKLNQRTPGHPDFRGPAPVKNGVTDYSPRPLKPEPDKDSSEKNEAMLLKHLVPRNEADEGESVKSKVKYKTKGDGSPVIIINPPEKTEEAQASFGVKPSGENGVIGGGSMKGGMQAKVGGMNGRKVNELGLDKYDKVLQRAQRRKHMFADLGDNPATKREFGKEADAYDASVKKLQRMQQHQPQNEVAPKGWEKTVKAMKKHKDIDNPWALANYMKNKGDTPHK